MGAEGVDVIDNSGAISANGSRSDEPHVRVAVGAEVRRPAAPVGGGEWFYKLLGRNSGLLKRLTGRSGRGGATAKTVQLPKQQRRHTKPSIECL